MCNENPPPEKWTLIYSVICIAVGVILALVFIYFGLEEQKKVDYMKPYMNPLYDFGFNPYAEQYKKSKAIAAVCFAGCACSVVHIFAGTFMLAGMQLKNEPIFMIGKVLSYFLPLFSSPAVVLLVVHILCILQICKYVKKTF